MRSMWPVPGISPVRIEPTNTLPFHFGNYSDDGGHRPPLKRPKKINDVLLLCCFKTIEALDHLIRFTPATSVIFDGVNKIRCSSVM